MLNKIYIAPVAKRLNEPTSVADWKCSMCCPFIDAGNHPGHSRSIVLKSPRPPGFFGEIAEGPKRLTEN